MQVRKQRVGWERYYVPFTLLTGSREIIQSLALPAQARAGSGYHVRRVPPFARVLLLNPKEALEHALITARGETLLRFDDDPKLHGITRRFRRLSRLRQIVPAVLGREIDVRQVEMYRAKR